MAANPTAGRGDTSSEKPSTPQLHNAALPPGEASSSSAQPGAEPLAVANTRASRTKYKSPPAPSSSSITPPPSSQAPVRTALPDIIEDSQTTPTPTQTSSPPPTQHNGVKREAGGAVIAGRPTAAQISEASSAELRDWLNSSIAQNTKLDSDLKEARMLIAHHKLQYNMLSMETQEAAKRMEVEHDMTRREVEALQMAQHSRQTRYEMDSPTQTRTGKTIMELKASCQTLTEGVAILHERLHKSKRALLEKEEIISAVMEDNSRLRKRIRENREHITKLKSPGGLLAHPATPRASFMPYPTTPQAHGLAMKRTNAPGSARHHMTQIRHDRDDNQEPFAALLLADRVLSQENHASAPSTPGGPSRPLHQGSSKGHSRNVQSLSSLPTTPVRFRPMSSGSNSGLQPPIQFAAQTEPRYRTALPSQPTYHHHSHHGPGRTALPMTPTPQRNFERERQLELERQHSHTKERHRKSRDSTISASDMDEPEEHRNYASDSEHEEVHESQASQSAAAMLRRDPSESFVVRMTPTPPPAGPSQSQASSRPEQATLQSKILGGVTKPSIWAEKRKRGLEEEAREDAKRTRKESIGLGISH